MTTIFNGETVRGFRIGVRGNGRKAMLPAIGFPLYSGEQALEIMRRYADKRPGVEIHAVTYSDYAGHEVLTMDEMECLYDND